ncbi:hypothetical protein K443DRAFT_683823 [Laccaria amethystina LaAM-08-1]|uniref:Uncharacterized protein n=1 Tax=Laccaria amethystina LaAM-08-1 TaxID=1095629 RepID=A0A0C9XDV1_9AGAR|nr:hypothetical protein K443DRAFT_683823 [Laccaria amethystina LaAM-08-1]
MAPWNASNYINGCVFPSLTFQSPIEEAAKNLRDVQMRGLQYALGDLGPSKKSSG